VERYTYNRRFETGRLTKLEVDSSSFPHLSSVLKTEVGPFTPRRSWERKRDEGRAYAIDPFNLQEGGRDRGRE
jgi:hypothetical protein